jgi:hypothetical protein
MCEVSFKAVVAWLWRRSSGPHVMDRFFGRNNIIDAGSGILTV